MDVEVGKKNSLVVSAVFVTFSLVTMRMERNSCVLIAASGRKTEQEMHMLFVEKLLFTMLSEFKK